MMLHIQKHLHAHAAIHRSHPYLSANRGSTHKEQRPQSASSSLTMMMISRAVSGHRNGIVGVDFLFCGTTALGIGVAVGVGVADDIRELGTGVGVADIDANVGDGSGS